MSVDITPSRVGRPGPDPARVALFVAPITAYYYAKDNWLQGK
ncbi:hypothetical protein MGL_2339 [Malassezia globosa CBS 7966]|uniref:Uncharacterized protein n=1 Tax=Malassezia globosa (strain ATCC MYA-4612 / CBS 7966) TaxID=425265 RepID=A8Q393_MALGO|nr:uncharacterized protein MGL_2339 [Malassezia globosa CBS 7966]EDP43329.1 hypothetical protein MGL_2339 [Malassezia globosa CBS 7966]